MLVLAVQLDISLDTAVLTLVISLPQVFMEPLKKVQVEGHIMMAEPEMLFGNLDELCCVTYSFCKDFLHWLLVSVTPEREIPVTEVIGRLFEKEGKTRSLSQVAYTVTQSSSKAPSKDARFCTCTQAYHRYSLNYINALTYLESLRKHQEFCDFEKVEKKATCRCS